MPVYKIKDYKIINGEKLKKTKEEYNKETCKGKKTWYYQGYYTNINGEHKKYKSKKFATKDEASKEEARFLISAGESIVKNYTFNEIYKEYIEKKVKEVRPQTIIKKNNLYKYIKNNIGDIQINKLTLNQYEAFKNQLDKFNLSTDYKNRIHKLVITLINYSNTYYNITNKVPKMVGGFINPLEMKKEMNFFTKEEFDKFISVIDNIIWRTIFETLFYCGLRKGEMQALNWNDIDLEQNTINVNKTLTTKIKGEQYTIFPPKTKSSYRIIPMPKQLVNDIKKVYDIYSNLDGFSKDWFVFGGIRPVPETTIQNKKDKYCDMANLKHIRVHDFRHSCASLLISKNADPVLVAKFLGHSKVNMTLNLYSHMYKSKLDQIVNLIEN